MNKNILYSQIEYKFRSKTYLFWIAIRLVEQQQKMPMNNVETLTKRINRQLIQILYWMKLKHFSTEQNFKIHLLVLKTLDRIMVQLIFGDSCHYKQKMI
ncbi:unnamed protein product [Paramecium sonneborni]|uniref:Uncharacterized protein n=1 Tax=Paramecium sonneborni TaxID=65129 RepID=A0A8S1L1Q9_9CILI|nr:unnamed protein product [Paramecium sonneborni]